jgi:P4 family phage/plasmid primase-like protien
MTQEKSAPDGAESPSAFIANFFGAYTAAPIFITSLPNTDARGREGGPRETLTRDRSVIDAFVRKHDRADRGLYFSVGPIRADAEPEKAGGSRRTKNNVADLVCLHVDIDQKDVTASKGEIITALGAMPLPPSVIVDSGRGIHVYWLLSESLPATPENIAFVERLNILLAEILCGDRCHDVSRLMRLPGSHNTKEGGFLPVRVVSARFEPRYELDDLETMLGELEPILTRRAGRSGTAARAVANVVEDNPFVRLGAIQGLKPPLDVQAALDTMNENGIHNTMLSVSASMMAKGHDVEEVVERLMPAIESANGPRWNAALARADERKLRGMCADFLRKYPDAAERAKEAEARAAQSYEDEALEMSAEDETARQAQAQPKRTASGDVVVSLSEERTRREKKKPRKSADGDEALHIKLARVMLDRLEETGEAILFTKQAAYHYHDGLWLMEVDGLRAWLNVKLEEAIAGLGLESRNSLLTEARGWVERQPALWRDQVAFDQHGMVPTRSGLLDPRSLKLTPARPDHYCTWRVEADFDPAATCPIWALMLGDTFSDRPSQVRADLCTVLQEVLGASLIDSKSRGMSRALVLVGGSNYGKSGLLDVLSGLHGEDVNSTSLDQLEGTHGMMGFMRRVPWVLHEAFNQAKWHTSSTVKAIITGDPVPINIKNGPILNRRISAPIFWGTNSPPQFKETTLAVVNRLIIIHCKRVFNDREPVGAALLAQQQGFSRPSELVLATERSGLLNWAVAGLQSALARGSIFQPDEVREAGEEMHRDSNLAAGFIADCIEFDAEYRVSVPDFCAAFASWWAQEKGTDRFIPSNEAIGKAVLALSLPRLAYHPSETRDMKRRYYCGVKLNAEGEAFWKRALQARAFENKLASTTIEGEAVNTAIPANWASRGCIQTMRMASAGGMTVAETGMHDSENANCHATPTVMPKTVMPGSVMPPVMPELSCPQGPDPFGESVF